jgi:hypothetical protein
LAILCTGGVFLLGLLFVPLPDGLRSPWGQALQNAAHLPMFALLLTLNYAVLLRLGPGSRKRALLVAIPLTLALGGASEWAQSFSSRTASWRDFLADFAGVAAASVTIAGVWLKDARLFPCWLVTIAGTWAVSTFLVTRPLLLALSAERQQSKAFPHLGDFEEEWERILWLPQGDGGNRPTQATPQPAHSTRGRQSLKVETSGARWAGVRILVQDSLPWPEARLLRFDIFNPGNEFKLGIRVDSVEGDRFTGELHIAPGANRCSVAPETLANRDRNLSDPAAFASKTIVFHLGESPATRSFYLDNVRLE